MSAPRGGIFRRMNLDIFQQNWALAVAAVLFIVVAIVIGSALLRRSPWGQLRRARSDFRVCGHKFKAAHAQTVRAQKHLKKLETRASNVKPRLLEEAKGLVADGLALEKIAGDRLMIAANHVRRVIHEEYPPSKQERLRKRYLPDDDSKNRPFTF